MIEILYNSAASLQSSGSELSSLTAKGFLAQQQAAMISREEHMMKELSLSRGRKPRRAQTLHDYVIPLPPSTPGASTTAPIRLAAGGIPADAQPQPSPSGTLSTIVSPAATPAAEEPSAAVVATPKDEQPRRPRRPALGPPRRSYSVMNHEPQPHHHRLPPAGGKTLQELPGELHYAIFDFLDPIDSTCLGLTNKHFYAIHRRMHGSVSLTARRDGPNELEWAWHLAGAVVKASPTSDTSAVLLQPPPSAAGSATMTMMTTTNTLGNSDAARAGALARLRVRGQALCRKCGVTRCELHKHIQDWMGEGREYCSVREKYGPAAPEGAKAYCYMSSPRDAHRCGRHRVLRKDKVVLQ